MLTNPTGDKAVYTCDSEHRQTAVTDWDGQEFTFTYDAEGNLTSKQYDNGEMERYRYDAAGRRIRMDEYDKNGTQKTYTVYRYDANDNRTATCTRVPTTPVKNWEEANNTGTWAAKT